MPSTMLSLLLEREADRFYQRFTKATEMLEDEILSIRNRALTELDQIEKHLKTISAKTDAILTDLGIEDPISTRRKQLLEKMTSILKDIGVSESGIKQFIDSIVK
jgi:16S rRNA C1402 N4-methylase RsmH